MSDFDWAAEYLRRHGIPEEIVGDVDQAAMASLQSAKRLAVALAPADPLPLILGTTIHDATVLDTTAGGPR